MGTKLHARRSFIVRGTRYRYYAGAHNNAWSNERTVELAIALPFLSRAGNGRVLEVGNVLSHYVPTRHDVVDKYEQAPGVLNADVLDFQPDGPYDLIVSISTLEHVGWDEDVVEADKPLRAIDHLAGMLAPGGTLLVTLPLGYNPHLDEALRNGAHHLDDVAFVQRISRDNRWRETTASVVAGARYGDPFPAANALAIGARANPSGSGRLNANA
jgi:SAM-dependent methyltransferase